MVPPHLCAPVTELSEIMETKNQKRKRAVTVVVIQLTIMELPQYPTTPPAPTGERLVAIIRIKRRTPAPHSTIGYKFLNNPSSYHPLFILL